MKKILSIYLIILIGIFIALSIVDRRSNYVIEREIWKIYQQQLDIAKDPAVVPSRSFEKAINGYKKIITKYPNSHFIPGVHIRIGEMHMLNKDYEGARTIFYDLIKLFPDNKEIAAEALLKIGGTYEVTGNWPKAHKVYQDIIQEYTLTDVGLTVPIHIANYYKNQNDFQATMNAYEFAIRHYSSIASTHKTKAGLTAMRHLANSYLDQNRWSEAISTLGSILEKYTASNYLTAKDVDMLIKTINITAAYQLKDYDIAISLYQGIIARNPNHPLKNYLNRVIDAFNQLEEKGIQVSDR